MSRNPLIILTLGSMASLGKRIAATLTQKDLKGFKLAEVERTQFANGEIKTAIPITLRHHDVYLIAPLQDPNPNIALMELLIAGNCISLASAESLTLVLPYMCYSRQDRKAAPREPITARLMADQIQTNRLVQRILTFDLHSDQVQGFYKIPVDNLYGASIHRKFFAQEFKGDFRNVVVVSPDFGGAQRARRFAKKLSPEVPVYMIDKRRTGPNQAEALQFVGDDITGKNVIIYDDMIDTGGSIIAASRVALERGARSIVIAATHGVFSDKDNISISQRFGQAINEGLPLRVVVTETIARSSEYATNNQAWLTILPIDEFLAEAIYQAATVGGSVSSLFDHKD